ncbi:MAG: hypothetical protein JWQ75_4117 [Pseudarthrobacter sp.]|nr:hypothetical protein [Pseudarthrobacter sp.]
MQLDDRQIPTLLPSSSRAGLSSCPPTPRSGNHHALELPATGRESRQLTDSIRLSGTAPGYRQVPPAPGRTPGQQLGCPNIQPPP